jgi:3',5'-cyclic AMP phosphodiesterase CpdA|tara:strand:- start:953 stop:1807 length:855 start_codon:yes stop_codon:yes gene_type:complete
VDVLVAQITDCHIRCDDKGAFSSLVDTSATLAAVVEHLEGLDPQPDVVLATGDVTDNGTPEQYAWFREILEPLTSPLLPFPGNHDHGPAFRTAFADLLPGGLPERHCSYVVDDHPVRLVGIDTSKPDHHDGCFDDERADWLDGTLAAAPDRPTLVFTHLPPIRVGLDYMDVAGLTGADLFEEVVATHPQVALVVAGHLHRPIQAVIGSALLSVCPSTGFQLDLDLNPARGGAVDEPPGFQLHRWDGERFITHTGMVRKGRRLDITGYVRDVLGRAQRGEGFPKG